MKIRRLFEQSLLLVLLLDLVLLFYTGIFFLSGGIQGLAEETQELLLALMQVLFGGVVAASLLLLVFSFHPRAHHSIGLRVWAFLGFTLGLVMLGGLFFLDLLFRGV
ncbi:hypothetical protein [Spirochaeta thermophila]|uniref:Uncharacterized protein n=1 Tax=Winmispira thermophila (strain ATCC 49972 / DSM 6192 / RI 19.B1) TaxID=665571 RepID=E0RSN2_WINT6|nr:hypothetical protein [Spirochaeta thermophila]ADN02019.1 hypothetical protein STHERM_c10740 [Spirochaeta thermophila DSM 6192]